MIIPGWIKPAALAIGLLTAAYGGYHYRDVVADRDSAEVQAQARLIYIESQKKVEAYQQALQGMANKLEEQSYENQKKRDSELVYYRNLVEQLGGLYDSGTATGDSPATGNPSSTQATPGGTGLSAEATAFLLNLANQADRVTDQYLQCQQYVLSITEQSINEATK